MSIASPALHGGDVVRVAAQLKCSPHDILDFSANINPRGLPGPAREVLRRSDSDKLLRYPDSACHPLRRNLAERHGLPKENIVLGAGGAALIMDAFRALRPRRCLCFVPAFGEYRRASEAVGAEFHCIQLQPDSEFRIDVAGLTGTLERLRPELLVLNNPHNPSGSIVERGSMEAIVDLAAGFGTKVLLDEAFIDYVPSHQSTSLASRRSDVIAIGSLTKFYGCPGLRIGYAVAHDSLVARIERQMPAWPVGALAMDMLDAAIQDTDYRERTLKDTGRERACLADALTHLGLKVYPASANFLLIELPVGWPDAPTLKSALLSKQRILIRDCSSFEGFSSNRFIRTAVMERPQNECLIAALREMV